MSEAKETIITDDEPEHDDTDELYQSVFIKNEKTRPLPGSNTSIYKQKFDCFLSSVRLIALLKICSQIYAVSLNFT